MQNKKKDSNDRKIAPKEKPRGEFYSLENVIRIIQDRLKDSANSHAALCSKELLKSVFDYLMDYQVQVTNKVLSPPREKESQSNSLVIGISVSILEAIKMNCEQSKDDMKSTFVSYKDIALIDHVITILEKLRA